MKTETCLWATLNLRGDCDQQTLLVTHGDLLGGAVMI